MPRRRANTLRKPRRPNRFMSNNNYGSGPASSGRMLQPAYKPVVHFTRKVESRFDIPCNGIAPSVGSFLFTLDTLPDYTDFTSLFQAYRITKVKVEWYPEYTELTDAALVSNAVNVNFNSAIDPTGTSPAAVSDVTQYQSCKSTGITRQHKRTLKPSILMGGITPCNCAISTQSPSERHYSILYGIPPTGVAMTFRSVATFFIECSGAR